MKKLLRAVKSEIGILLIRLNHSRILFSFLSNSEKYSSFNLAEIGGKLFDYKSVSFSMSTLQSPILLFSSDKNFNKRLHPKSVLMSKKEKAEVDFCLQFLSLSQVEQMRLLRLGFDEYGCQNFELRGSLITNQGSILNAVLGLSNLFYLVSINRTVDCVFFPKSRLVISVSRESMGWDQKTKLMSDLTLIGRHRSEDFSSQWNDTMKFCETGLVLQKNRVMEHVDQEVVGAIEISRQFGSLNLYIRDQASFFSSSVYRKIGFSKSKITTEVDHEKLLEISKQQRLFHVWWPNTSAGKSSTESHWLEIRKASITESDFLFPDGKTGVYLSITSGEKRDFLDESESLAAIIDWSLKRWGSVHFIFDGWTARLGHPGPTSVLAEQNKILLEAVSKSGIDSSSYSSLIGSRAENKVLAATKCVAFVSAGSPIVWPSKIAGIPGVIHGHPEALRQWNRISVGPGEKVRFVEKSKITVLGSRSGRMDIWHHRDYSIPPEHILECFKAAVENYTTR